MELLHLAIDWPTLLVVLGVFGFLPRLVLRFIVRAWPRDDPRRDELISELDDIEYWKRPLWVAEQLETALVEGIPARLGSRRAVVSSKRIWVPARKGVGRRSVLIVSASMGAGHDGAAKELRRRLEATGHRVEVIDFLDAVAFNAGTLMRWFYLVQLRMAPWSYELSYKLAPALRVPTVILDTWLTRRRLRRAIREFRPDAVVSVYPFASLVLGRMRRTKQLRVPVLTYLTDFGVHSLWVHRGVDRHLGVSQASAEAVMQRGRSLDVRARGPLVSERFRDVKCDREAVRSNLGLAADDRAVLVVAGSWGVGDVVETVEAIGRSGEFHPITVCGCDDNLRAELEARGLGTVIGWTDEMAALMSAADALVENAGGLTCMEAFAVGLPVITYKPIAGHGKVNAEVMARSGVNCYARDEDQLHDVLRTITRPGAARDALVEAAHGLFVADPTDDVDELAHRLSFVDRKGRVVPLGPRRLRLRSLILAASVAYLAFALLAPACV